MHLSNPAYRSSLPKHTSLFPPGGHQADEPAAAAQEGTDHQRDLSHEGK